jgi:hypothetical protein
MACFSITEIYDKFDDKNICELKILIGNKYVINKSKNKSKNEQMIKLSNSIMTNLCKKHNITVDVITIMINERYYNKKYTEFKNDGIEISKCIINNI